MTLRTAILLLLVGLAVTGCGRRPRALDPPDANHDVYPKKYPPPDTQGDRL